MKVKWEVSAVPKGRYRPFERRVWPSGESENGYYFRITCQDEYKLSKVKAGDHKPLKVVINKKGFLSRFRMNRRFDTLKELKEYIKEWDGALLDSVDW